MVLTLCQVHTTSERTTFNIYLQGELEHETNYPLQNQTRRSVLYCRQNARPPLDTPELELLDALLARATATRNASAQLWRCARAKTRKATDPVHWMRTRRHQQLTADSLERMGTAENQLVDERPSRGRRPMCRPRRATISDEMAPTLDKNCYTLKLHNKSKRLNARLSSRCIYRYTRRSKS